MKMKWMSSRPLITAALLVIQVLQNCVFPFSPCPRMTRKRAFSATLVISPSILPLLYGTNNGFEADFVPNIVENVMDEIDAIYESVMGEEQSWNKREISEYYQRDIDDDLNTPLADEIGLKNLLSKRFHAYKSRNWSQVQEIDQKLRIDHGVRAYDNPNVWTRQSQPPLSERRKRARAEMDKLKSLYGPTGHPFQQIGGPIDSIFCSLDITQIHTLLSRWMQSRSLNRYEEADAIRFELSLYGVYFDDRSYSWRADGEISFPKTVQKTPDVELLKKYSSISKFENSESQRRVDHLVSMRSDAIARGETAQGDFIAFELWMTYGVGIDDDTKTYFLPSSKDEDILWEPPVHPAGDSSVPKSSPMLPILFDNQIVFDEYSYTPIEIGYEDRLPQPTRARIEQLLYERKVKLEERKFIEADAIRYELLKSYAVKANDETRKWRIDWKEFEKKTNGPSSPS